MTMLAVGMLLLSYNASAQTVYVNITNNTVYIKFGDMTVINFTSTLVNLGWVNNTHLASVYNCLYAFDPAKDCDAVRVEVYEGTVLRYTSNFIPSTSNTLLCPSDLKGVCYGLAVFNVSSFNDTANIIVKNLDDNTTSGPYSFDFPYTGPELTGYAQFIPLIIPYAILMSLAGRLSMKGVGIGLFIYGLIAPVMIVLGVELSNIMLVSSLSIILGVLLIWFSND